MDIPDSFFHADEKGCKGFVEWGFMSTTSDKSIAIKYSGVEEGRPHAIVLEIRTGAVDRGACIQQLSQYPQVLGVGFVIACDIILILKLISGSGISLDSVFVCSTLFRCAHRIYTARPSFDCSSSPQF